MLKPLKYYIRGGKLESDAIYPGGSTALCKKTDNEIGKCKCDWAKNIAPLMDVDNNQSPSFRHFKETVETLVE